MVACLGAEEPSRKIKQFDTHGQCWNRGGMEFVSGRNAWIYSVATMDTHQFGRQAAGQASVRAGRQRQRTDGRTDRQRQTETDRQTDRHTDTQTDR